MRDIVVWAQHYLVCFFLGREREARVRVAGFCQREDTKNTSRAGVQPRGRCRSCPRPFFFQKNLPHPWGRVTHALQKNISNDGEVFGAKDPAVIVEGVRCGTLLEEGFEEERYGGGGDCAHKGGTTRTGPARDCRSSPSLVVLSCAVAVSALQGGGAEGLKKTGHVGHSERTQEGGWMQRGSQLIGDRGRSGHQAQFPHGRRREAHSARYTALGRHPLSGFCQRGVRRSACAGTVQSAYATRRGRAGARYFF